MRTPDYREQTVVNHKTEDKYLLSMQVLGLSICYKKTQ